MFAALHSDSAGLSQRHAINSQLPDNDQADIIMLPGRLSHHRPASGHSQALSILFQHHNISSHLSGAVFL